MNKIHISIVSNLNVIIYKQTSNADLSSSISVSNSGNFLLFSVLCVTSLLEIRRPRGVRLVKLSSTNASITV